MTKKILVVLLVSTLIVALFASAALSKASYDNRARVAKELSKRILHYSLPQVAPKPVAWGDLHDPAEAVTSYPPARRSLGAAMAPAGVSSPGFKVVSSMNDNQFFPGGNRQIDFNIGAPTMHFAYGAAKSIASAGAFGYNVYDPIAGDWPRGVGVGCEVQPTDGEGLYVNMAVTPEGYVILGGIDDAGGSLDNHFYYQSMLFSCNWQAGTIIAPSQYNVNFLTPSNYLNQPRIEVQLSGTDTITHVIAVESHYTITHPGNPFDIRANTINYFRKFGGSHLGTWEGPVTIDSMNSSSEVRNISNGSQCG